MAAWRPNLGRLAKPRQSLKVVVRLGSNRMPVLGWDAGRTLRWRRLVRDYEKRIQVSKAMIFVVVGGDMLRRNAHP